MKRIVFTSGHEFELYENQDNRTELYVLEEIQQAISKKLAGASVVHFYDNTSTVVLAEITKYCNMHNIPLNIK